MKTANLLILSLLVISQTALAAQTVEKELGAFGDWKSALIKNHDLFQKDACLSDSKAFEDASTLEMYAEKQTDSLTDYVEPTVVVVTRGEPAFVRGVITDEDRSVLIHLTLVSTTANPPAFGLMARIDDRSKLIALLKAANAARVQLINEKNQVVKTLNFSLRGSSKSIDAALKGCALSIAN